MVLVGNGLFGLGIALVVGGLVVWLGCFAVRMVILARRRVQPARLIAIGFYSQITTLLGPSIVIIGLVLRGGAPWPFLILAVVFGAGPAALLVTRPVSFQPGQSGGRPLL